MTESRTESPLILIIEDNPVTRKMLRVTLQSEGYTVIEAEDGRSALEQMAARRPDGVLQDLLLPDVDGFELVQRLRALPEGAEIPILAVSGFLPGLEQARSSHVGFTDYLFKPVEPSRLLETVRVYLRPARRAPDKPGRGRRVLAVDDDPLQLKLLTIQLEQHGFEVTAAEDGVQALALACSAPPSAILSDVLMPNLDGFRLCQAVRQDPRLSRIPVVLASSTYAEEADRQLALSVGANALVLRTPDCREVTAALLAAEGQPPPATMPQPAELTGEYVYRVIRQLERQASLIGTLSNRLAVLEAQIAISAGLAETLKRTVAIDTVLDELLHRSLDAVGVSSGAAYLVERDGQLLLRSQLGYSGTAERALPDFFGHTGLLRAVMAAGEPAGVPSPGVPESQSRDLLERAGAQSLLITPLVLGVEPLGVLVMVSANRDLSSEWIPFTRALGSQLSQAIGLARALNERRLLEEQLLQAQKMEAVGRLAGGVAHDFNNMIGAIGGYAELLLQRLPPNESVHSALQEIIKASDRAAILTRQLLLFSRKQTPAPRVLDLGKVLEDVQRMLRRLIGEDIQMICVSDPTVGRVKADPGQIEQVMMNLAVNARDAMPYGGQLTIAVRDVFVPSAQCAEPGAQCPVPGEGVIAPGTEHRAPYVLLEVSDTGCGMDAATQSRIFEPFFTTKEPGKGTGLGLATVYAIVDQAGGQIQVESEPGKGARFKIYLPQTEEEPSPAATADTVAEPAGGSETILVVEDEPIVQRVVRTVLEAAGYTVLEAAQGDEALRLCEQYHGGIDLILADVVLPGMNGRELAERVTAWMPEMKVLYMSGYTDDAVLLHGVRNAEMSFIQKPFTPGMLTRRVREVLDAA